MAGSRGAGGGFCVAHAGHPGDRKFGSRGHADFAALSFRGAPAHRPHGKPFWTLKLRSMWNSDHPEAAERGWIEYVVAEPDEDGKDRSDPRIASRFAAFCRRHSIDELPQLWHVARGEMSLVGPRPLTRSEVERHYGVRAAELLSVKPGITGLWQVYGRSAIRFPQRSAMDLEMIRSLNARMYLRILLRTIPAIIRGNGAW